MSLALIAARSGINKASSEKLSWRRSIFIFLEMSRNVLEAHHRGSTLLDRVFCRVHLRGSGRPVPSAAGGGVAGVRVLANKLI